MKKRKNRKLNQNMNKISMTVASYRAFQISHKFHVNMLLYKQREWEQLFWNRINEYTSVLLIYQNLGYEIKVTGNIWKEI